MKSDSSILVLAIVVGIHTGYAMLKTAEETSACTIRMAANEITPEIGCHQGAAIIMENLRSQIAHTDKQLVHRQSTQDSQAAHIFARQLNDISSNYETAQQLTLIINDLSQRRESSLSSSEEEDAWLELENKNPNKTIELYAKLAKRYRAAANEAKQGSDKATNHALYLRYQLNYATLLRTNNTHAALQAMEEILLVEPNNYENMWAAANLAKSKGDNARQLHWLTKILAHPRSGQAIASSYRSPLRDSAVAYNRLAVLYQYQGDIENALIHLSKSRDFLQALTQAKPKITAWQRDLAASYANLSILQSTQGNTAATLENKAAAHHIFQGLWDANPSGIDEMDDLANSFAQIGQLHEQLGDKTLALAGLERAVELRKKILTAQPNQLPAKHALHV